MPESGRAAALAAEHDRVVRGFAEAYLNHTKIKDLGLSQYRADEGDHFLRIIPYDDASYYGLHLYIHFKVGPDGGSVLCPRQMLKQTCPICRTVNTLKQGGMDWKDPVMSALRLGKPRTLFLVLDAMNAGTLSQGLQFYIAPSTVNEAVQGLCRNKRTGEYIDPFGVRNEDGTLVPGYNLNFTRKGKTMLKTEYLDFALEEEKEAPDPELYLDRICNPMDLLVIPTEQEITEIFDFDAIRERTLNEQDSQDDRGRGRRDREPAPARERQPVSRPSREPASEATEPERRPRRAEVANEAPEPAPEPRRRAAEPAEEGAPATRDRRAAPAAPATRERQTTVPRSAAQQAVQDKLKEVRGRQRAPEPEPEGEEPEGE